MASFFQVGNAVVCNLVPNGVSAGFAVHSVECDRIIARVGVIVPFHGGESHEACVHVHHRVHVASLRLVRHVVDEFDGVTLVIFVFENLGGKKESCGKVFFAIRGCTRVHHCEIGG